MAEYLYFNSRDELLRISRSCIVYIEASGNYTIINQANGARGMVGMAMSVMEQMLVASSGEEKSVKFARIGKSHIINLNYVFSINPLKQKLVLSDQKTFSFTLDISKDALRKLKDMMIAKKQITKQNGNNNRTGSGCPVAAPANKL